MLYCRFYAYPSNRDLGKASSRVFCRRTRCSSRFAESQDKADMTAARRSRMWPRPLRALAECCGWLFVRSQREYFPNDRLAVFSASAGPQVLPPVLGRSYQGGCTATYEESNGGKERLMRLQSFPLSRKGSSFFVPDLEHAVQTKETPYASCAFFTYWRLVLSCCKVWFTGGKMPILPSALELLRARTTIAKHKRYAVWWMFAVVNRTDPPGGTKPLHANETSRGGCAGQTVTRADLNSFRGFARKSFPLTFSNAIRGKP